MARKLVCVAVVALALQIIGAARVLCPNDPNCVCGGTFAVELNCNIDGRKVKINLLPDTYMNIICENATSLDYSKMPKCANLMNSFKSVSFKDCPLPTSSFKDVLMNMGVSKTMALIFQNGKNLSGYFDRKHFAGLQDLTKLLLSINGITHLPDNLFTDINKLTWLNIRSNTINLSEELFKPLEKLETLEISHNHMTNISSNLFSHLSYLRKLSLWQSNVTWFSKDLFMGVDVLEELDLSSNGLNELPSAIFKPLRRLKKLTLFSNKFSVLPQSLLKHNEELETVVILNNDVKLKEVPKYFFGGLVNLKEIYMKKSGLEYLPYDAFAGSPKVTNISLAYNDIETLPEAVFNDQINLLELDLSHNKLNSLEPKIFSSLVRLERLHLNHNRLVKITGSTFSSLLSLMYLNMEHNSLKTISSYLFSNTRQKMVISLAYNKLNFETKKQTDNATSNKSSPFVHTYNLKLLNLSHNNFKVSFDDWWTNGHDNLDISHNRIRNLWPEENLNKSYRDVIKKKLNKLWLGANPLYCQCWNYLFVDFLMEDPRTKIYNRNDIGCPRWARRSCQSRYSELVSGIIIAVIFYLLVIISFVVYRNDLMTAFALIIKQKYYAYWTYWRYKNHLGLIIAYDRQDKGFVYQEFMPALKDCSDSPVGQSLVTVSTNKDKFKLNVKRTNNATYIVIFSPNYLRTQFTDVSIINILSMMKDAQNTVYVFADIGGHDDSIYAFLKEQRDIMNSVVWNEPNFWEKFAKIVDLPKIGHLVEDFKNMNKSADPSENTDTHTVLLPEKDTMFLDYFGMNAFSGHFFHTGNYNGVYYQSRKD